MGTVLQSETPPLVTFVVFLLLGIPTAFHTLQKAAPSLKVYGNAISKEYGFP